MLAEETALKYVRESLAYKKQVYSQRIEAATQLTNTNQGLLVPVPKVMFDSDYQLINPHTITVAKDNCRSRSNSREKRISSLTTKRRKEMSEDIALFTKITLMAKDSQLKVANDKITDSICKSTDQLHTSAEDRTKPQTSHALTRISSDKGLSLLQNYIKTKKRVKSSSKQLPSLVNAKDNQLSRKSPDKFIYKELNEKQHLQGSEYDEFLTNFINPNPHSGENHGSLLTISRDTSPIGMTTHLPKGNYTTPRVDEPVLQKSQ